MAPEIITSKHYNAKVTSFSLSIFDLIFFFILIFIFIHWCWSLSWSLGWSLVNWSDFIWMSLRSCSLCILICWSFITKNHSKVSDPGKTSILKINIQIFFIQIPSNPPISSECRDLLQRLLQHDPEDRISFENFFQHPFIDLQYRPSPLCIHKAVKINFWKIISKADINFRLN